MQPMLMIRSAVPGMVFVNGRFAGEADAESAVSMPVGARGTLYMELRPFGSGLLPLAKRIALSQGRPVAASLLGQGGLSCVSWPGGVLDVEFFPQRAGDAPLVLEARGLRLRLAPGMGTLEASTDAEAATHRVPDGARLPDVIPAGDGGWVLLGDAANERYLLALGASPQDRLLWVTGKRIDVNDDLSVRALSDVGDTVGHALIRSWNREAHGYRQNAPEALWAEGSPRWPDTPGDTAQAALWAAMLGLHEELGGYLAPGFPSQGNEALAQAAQSDGCVALKYPLPDGTPAVGLIRLLGENLVEVLPVGYNALPSSGGQGMWRLERLWMVQ